MHKRVHRREGAQEGGCTGGSKRVRRRRREDESVRGKRGDRPRCLVFGLISC